MEGTNLFDIDEAISKGTIVMNLLSDAAQSETWPSIKPQLTKEKVRNESMAKTLGIKLMNTQDSVLLSRFLPRVQRPHQG